MLIVPVAFALLTTIPRPAAMPPTILRQAIMVAQQSRVVLQRAPQHQRGEPYQLPPKTGRRVAFVIMGAAAGFFASTVIPIAASHGDGGPPMSLVIGGTIGGAVLGGLLAGG